MFRLGVSEFRQPRVVVVNHTVNVTTPPGSTVTQANHQAACGLRVQRVTPDGPFGVNAARRSRPTPTIAGWAAPRKEYQGTSRWATASRA